MAPSPHHHGRLPALAAWNGASWFAVAAYNFALSAIVFRTVTPAAYGIWATIVALRTVLLLIDGGLALGVSRDAALEADDASRRARMAAAQRLYRRLGIGAAAVGLLGAGVPGRLLGVTGDIAVVGAFAAALFAMETGATFWASPYVARLRGHQRFDRVAAAAAIQAGVGMSLAVLLVLPFGLVGAAAAALGGRLASLGVLSLRWNEARIGLTSGFQSVGMWDVTRFAAPMWIVAVAGQVSFGTDVPIVGVVYGPGVAGRYSVGAMLPAGAIGLLFVLLDAAFPRLARVPTTRPALGLRLILVGSFLAALGFATLLLHADAVLLTWLGEAPATSIGVMTIYSVAWSINVPAHIVILMAVAAGRHSILATIAVAEGLTSVALGVVLALLTPLGPGIGTLTALTISNVFVTPLLVLPSIGVSWRKLATAAVSGYGLGCLGALPGAIATHLLPESSLLRVTVAIASMVIVAGIFVITLTRYWQDRPLASGGTDP
jgi:O-antigen/teichoic acid export membrane protein